MVTQTLNGNINGVPWSEMGWTDHEEFYKKYDLGPEYLRTGCEVSGPNTMLSKDICK